MPEKPKGPILPTPDLHTLVKHDLLKKYLNAWFPILTSPGGYPRVIFIDGFAGSGIYQDGKKGSPIIAIETALRKSDKNTTNPINKQVDFIFIEQDKERFGTLEEQISKLERPKNFSYTLKCGDFNEELPKILKFYKALPLGFSAAFVFIDPFGYKVPIRHIKEIMENKSCEVLITFMYDEINRFLKVETSDNCRDELFGSHEWATAENETPRQRIQILHDLYQRQLKEIAGIKYVRSFQMINSNNATDYFLFFGTNSQKGLREMKRAMWDSDKTGSFRFRDNTNPLQTVLFDEPNFEDLKTILKNEFTGRQVSITEIERFVLEETPFRDNKHLREPVLSPMERTGEIEVFDSIGKPRKGRGFDNTLIAFKATLF